MKKYLSILLSIVMVLSIMSVSVFATEPTDDTTTTSGQTHIHEDGTVHEGAEHTDGEDGTQTDDTTQQVEEEQNGYLKGKITEVSDVKEESIYGMYTIKVQPVKVEMLEGKYAGQQFDSVYYLTQDYNGTFEAKPLQVGDKVYAGVEEGTNEETGEATTSAYVVQKMRDTNLLIAGLLVAAVLLIIGTMSGVKTLGLVVANTVVAMVAFFALYLNGVNNILSLLALVIPIIIIDVLIISGFKKESWVSILAVVISTIITIGIFALLNNCLSVIGLTEYATYLSGVDAKLLVFDYLDLLVAGAMIMSLGVAIDMSIRAVRKGSQGKAFGITLKEVARKLPNKLNTVFLAWLGGFMTIFTIFVLYSRPILEILNVETIVIEIIKIMVIFLNTLIVIPIGILLSRELLKTRGLVEAKEENTEVKNNEQ